MLFTVVLKKSLESPLGCKEIQPVNPKGNQSWVFIGRTPMLWPPYARTDSLGKSLMLEDKGTAEDEMVGWHYQLDGYEFEQALGVSDGQGSLMCCSPRGRNESPTTKRLNWSIDNSKHQESNWELALLCSSRNEDFSEDLSNEAGIPINLS